MNTSDWINLIEECQSSGLKIKHWCEKNGITYRQYRYWFKKLQNQTKQWAQVAVNDVSTESIESINSISSEIKLYCGKWTITVENEVSLKLFSDVLKAVDAVCS